MRFCASPSASFWRQGWKRSAVLRLDRVAQLLQHRLAVADDRDVDIARRVAHFLGVDLDARDLRVGVEARRRGVADHVVRPRAEDDDQIGVAERVVAHRQIGIGVVVGHHAAPLRGRVERDPGLLDKRPHLVPGLRPQDAAARDDDRLSRLVDRVDERVDRLRLGIGTRLDDRPAAIAPIDVAPRRPWCRARRPGNRDRPGRACRSAPSGTRNSPAAACASGCGRGRRI